MKPPYTAAAVAAVALFAFPLFRVWDKKMNGVARLAQAEHDRRIAVEEAKAERESATYSAHADSIRALGIASANRIIAETITPEYLQWKWIQGLQNPVSEVIYIPTENQLPLMLKGAGR